MYKDYDLVQWLKTCMVKEAIPGKDTAISCIKITQDGQYYFAFEVYLPGGKDENDYSNATHEGEAYLYSLYQYWKRAELFKRIILNPWYRDKYPAYGASNLDDKLEVRLGFAQQSA